MSTCLDTIISVKNMCGDTEPSLSGLDLFDAPEISTKILADISNEEFISGRTLAQSKVTLAGKLVVSDLRMIMAANNVLPNLTDINYTAATYKTGTTIAAANINRGLVYHKAGNWQGSMRKAVIHNVYAYPLIDATNVTLYVYDSWAAGVLHEYTVDLVADEVNTFNIEYTVRGEYARVYFNGNNLSFYSSYLTCFTGCDGKLPNNCGYVKSFYNDKEISGKEGYGLNIDFSCVCDYEELLCGLAKDYLGVIVWYKARIELMEELIKTDRLNNFTVYNRDESKGFLNQLKADYVSNWNTFANSFPSILENMRDSCLNCRGIKWQVNL